MSNARSLTAVTATLRHLLNTQVSAMLAPLAGLSVTSVPPDMTRKDVNKPPQINIFLYQTVINAAWRNMDMPRQVRPGEQGVPPLALNLHYLVTAYGADDNDNIDASASHLLIGAAMSVLHDHPVLGREEINNALAASNLGGQLERIRITPVQLSLDELSKLWSTFQAPYRFSAAYECAVVLIDSTRTGAAALPVLRRGPQDEGVDAVTGSGPLLRSLLPPHHQSAGRLGDQIELSGEGLQSPDARLRFVSVMPPPLQLPGDPVPLPPPLVELTPMTLTEAGPPQVLLQELADDPQAWERWAPGSYVVSPILRPAGLPPRPGSAAIAFALAPTVTLTPNSTTAPTVSPGDVLTLTCTPRLRHGQQVIVLFDDVPIAPLTIVHPDRLAPGYLQTPSTVTFRVPAAAAYLHVVRLRVDGIDSIPVIHTGDPALPSFDPEQQVML
ncbi:DUF4255 domain-containing protein [Massilia sp. B-10]|nr:DUF4255 domain-containing protein [Massilia sp. B-10]